MSFCGYDNACSNNKLEYYNVHDSNHYHGPNYEIGYTDPTIDHNDEIFLDYPYFNPISFNTLSINSSELPYNII